MIERGLAMIIIRDNAVWWRRPDGAETQATPRQCVAEIERLRAELSHALKILTDRENEITRLRAERAWQPIETAPKEEAEPVLLYKPDEGRFGEYLLVGYWGEWPGEGECWIACAGYNLRPPTHWQPLPAPPEDR
jgi:hypothetical protein